MPTFKDLWIWKEAHELSEIMSSLKHILREKFEKETNNFIIFSADNIRSYAAYNYMIK